MDPHNKNVGSMRWADEALSNPSNQESKVTINTSNSILETSDDVQDNQGLFCMNVKAFEKSLKEKRDQQLKEQSPQIKFHLRETFTCSPKEKNPSSSETSVHRKFDSNIEHSLTPGTSSTIDEVDYVPSAQRRVKRVITYEKISKTKSIRETSCPETYTTIGTIESPTVQRTLDGSIDGISTELMAGIDDSAYYSHRIRIASSGTPTSISISSSSNSLQHDFQCDENIHAQTNSFR